ncbi:DNA-binding protein [Rhodococcus sp. D2-41]|uniref:OB-fold domain-containing protein n=1 Tax=Speluncibacter jeojiensis TaxID=2710754 RepID=A0A9X4REE9_9ACTN|nr:OB-fold nucleic acid binding domain-containing protein [Rhodococcus sp. D2-41]MDG3011502.1 DNA-binding protein [Rhodococcus sp. D2-41]MDG3015142.1 OB-fold domain-containing protein [Corynebacteriales bacterium D3-21]
MRKSVVELEPPSLEPLSAALDLAFDYTRSVGPTIGRFLGGLRAHRVIGVRGSDGRVHVPPVEYDPVTAAPLDEFVEVSAVGTVVSWSWVATPIPEHPLDRPFAFALIKLDGADTTMLHAVDVGTPEQISTGMRVRIRWAETTVGAITDIACFEPGDTPAPVDAGEVDDVEMIITPIGLHIDHSASSEESAFLRALKDGKLIGQRCPASNKVYLPPRGASPTHGVPTKEEVPLPDTGTVTTFCIVNIPFQGQRIKPPYVAAYILVDGADIPMLHLVLGCDPSEVRMGMRVRAVWKPAEERGYSNENIDHFEPTGEPDAPFESYSQHL